MSPVDPTRPLLVTGDPALLDDLLRLAAAAGVEPEVAADPAPARRSWSAAPVVLVGADLTDACIGAQLPRRDDVVLVGLDLDDASVWERAVRLGAAHVIFLPDAEPWLVDLLADATEPPGPVAAVVGVVGGRGGAGATSLVVALALGALRRGLRTLLVDADPLGGGIDLTLGAEDASGLRWPALASSRGRVSHRALAEALPRVDGLAVLSWDRGDLPHVPPTAMGALLDSARRGSDLVVVDLPRMVDEAAQVALTRTTVALLVVPAEVRACAAAARVSAALSLRCPDVRVVVRGPAPGGLTADAVATSLALPLAASLRAEPGIAEALERGEPPGRRARGPLARFCERFLAEIAGPADRAAA